MEALQPVQNISFMRATIRRRFPKASNVTAEALLAVLIQKMIQSANNQSDSPQTSQLRLQMAMDRVSKLMETLSDLLTQIGDTGDPIPQNPT
jgi:hypothetical protein